MDKLLALILILAITLSSVTSHSLNKRQAGDQKNNEGMIIAEEVPVYYLEYTHEKYMKSERRTGMMPSAETLQNYGNKTNHLGTYFLNLLIIPDYDMYKKLGPMGIIDRQLHLWFAVDKYFQKLANPKIKLAISGIIFPTSEGIIVDGPSVTDGEKYYISNETLYNISKWLKDNEDNFEDLKYDAFVYLTSWPLKHYDDGRQRYIDDNSMTYPFVCDYKNHKDSEKTKPPGGIFYYNTDRSKVGVNYIYGAHFIAQGFSVPFDQDVGCLEGYVMDNWQRNYGSSWSGCSLSAFEGIKTNRSYACMELTLESMHEEEDYDD